MTDRPHNAPPQLANAGRGFIKPTIPHSVSTKPRPAERLGGGPRVNYTPWRAPFRPES